MITTGMLSAGYEASPLEKYADPSVLFGPDSTNIISHIFDIGVLPCVIEQFEMGEGDMVFVERVGGAGSGQYFNRLRIDGKTAILHNDNTALHLTLPGRYRLVYQGSTPLGAFLVQQTRY